MSRDLLNRYQRDSVANTLRMLEMTLRRALSELGNQEKGILYQRDGALADEQADQMRHTVDKGLHEIERLAQTLALPVEAYDNRSALLGQLNVLLVDLHAIRAESLRGYGEVNPDVAAILNPRLDRLTQLITELMSILRA